MAELKKIIDEGDRRLIDKLLYFSSAIPGTRQYLRYQSDKAISFVKFVRISSNDEDMFSFFQKFSATDFHWDDLHHICWAHKLTWAAKETWQSWIRTGLGTRQFETIRTSDFYFDKRLDLLLEHVLYKMGAEDWIILYKVQARGTIYVHLLLCMKGGPSHTDIERFQIQIPKDKLERMTEEEVEAIVQVKRQAQEKT